MVKANIKVCVRTRPTVLFVHEKIHVDTDQKTIKIQVSNDHPEESTLPQINNKQSSYKFKFDDTFYNSSQSEVYNNRARNLVQAAIEGTNGAILTYGQTGSGKTFTMLGDTSNYELRGLAPRALNQVFCEISTRSEYDYKVYCSYLEVYNDRIFDLLNDLSDSNQFYEYIIADDKDGRGTFIRGLNEIEVHSETEALNLLFGGELARTTATHKLNKRSNRSHSIFTIYIQRRNQSGSHEKIVHSKLHLVDLAGSERIKKTMENIDGVISDETTRKESMAINQSLSYLEQCVIALSRKHQSHIPYRQSKLTNILKDCLGSNCNTLVFACIWGEEEFLEETISTLRFASRMMKVENEITPIETIDNIALIKKQSKEIKTLKQELLMHDALVGRSGVNYDLLTPEQQSGIIQKIEAYLNANENDESVLQITSVTHMHEICRQFKNLLLKTRRELDTARNDLVLQSMTYVEGLGISTNDVKIVGSDDSTIGSVSSTSNFLKLNSGVAPLEPRTMILLNNAIMKTPSDSSIKETILKNSEGNLSQNCNEITPPQTKSVSANLGNNESEKNSRSDKILRKSNENRSNNPMFDSFITGDGKYLYDELTSNKESIKILKANMDETRIRANQSKKSIDELTLKIQNINNLETSQGETIHESTQNTIDNEKNEVVLGNLDSIREDYEVNILESLSGELKDLKQSYKESYLLYQNLKKSVQDKKQNILDLKSQLVESFCEWSGQPENTRSFSIHTTSDIEDEIDPVQSSSIEESDKQHVSKLRMKLLSEELEQERTIAKHPESIPFFEARRTSNALLSQNNHSIKLLKKYKRMR